MRFIIIFSIVIFSISTSFLFAQNISAEEIIHRSIQYHDPQGNLLKKEVTLNLIETRPNGADRKTTVGFHLKKERFQMTQLKDDNEIISAIDRDKFSFLLNGLKEISNADKEKYKLNEERITMMKDYYQYLWLMPLKLNDKGTNMNSLIKTVDFFGKQSLEIRITYDPGVGADVWYFYFNPESYAMQGYRFYHDEEKNDGEYIILENEVIHKNVRLPKERKWYTHKEDKFLGADILDSFSF